MSLLRSRAAGRRAGLKTVVGLFASLAVLLLVFLVLIFIAYLSKHA